MTQLAATRSTPWHLYAIGGLSLIWNAFGGYDYTMTQSGARAYLQPTADSLGVSAGQVVAYYDGFPFWLDFAWATGVWASVAGSVLLLRRSRFAYPAFVLSLIGLLATMPWRFTNPMPGAGTPPVVYAVSVLVLVVLVFLVWYARAKVRRGVLS